MLENAFSVHRQRKSSGLVFKRPRSLRVDNDSDTVWVGTGENVGGRHVGYGDGVYRSHAPLMVPLGATVVDTSGHTPEESSDLILEEVRRRLAAIGARSTAPSTE